MSTKNEEYGSLVPNSVVIPDPKKWRWLVIVLCMVAFLITFKLTAYGFTQDWTHPNPHFEITEYSDYGTIIKFKVLDLVEDVSYTITVNNCIYDNIMIYTGSDSSNFTLFCTAQPLYVRLDYVIQGFGYGFEYSSLSFDRITLKESTSLVFDMPTYVGTNYQLSMVNFESGPIFSTYTIYNMDSDNTTFFTSPPLVPWTILREVTLTSPLIQVVNLLPVVLLVIVTYLALRKALKMIMAFLRAS